MPGIKISELLVGALIFGIILIIIIPLPPLLLDVYISLNITLAVIAIGISLYISKPLDFAALPTFLLLATMFRLALNISTTRSILLKADAGNLIQAMGNFVAGGNIVVGIIIFVIITVVQFMVILNVHRINRLMALVHRVAQMVFITLIALVTHVETLF